MSDSPSHPNSITLLLPPEEHWTLHHVLLDRIEQETMAKDPVNIAPPPLDSSTWWETERSQIEQLLHRVAEPIEQHQSALPAE